MKTTLMISSLVALLALAGGGAWYYVEYAGAPRQSPFRTAEVARGDLLVTIDASGPIEPEEVVDVGAQVAGKIASLGKDPRGQQDPKFKDKTVDYGTNVKQGMLLAQIDDALYRAQRNSAAAALEHAKADLGELVAKRDQAEADWNRAQRLRNITHVSLSPEGVKDPNATPTPIKAISD
ncbi:MAG: hypothetical protein K8T25_22280, partial [Planctomycetia bacterium]|nr:hypothetical protein [Planctomycetia bacterium]